MTLCATCSSSDRSLVSISDVHWRILISVIGKGIPEAVYKLRNSLNLCFECNARIHNMCKFRENAIKSLQALQYHVKNINELKFTPTLGFACGSQMSVGPQDVDCISHSPEQNVSTEIKCVEDESMLSNVDMEPDKDPFQEKPIKEEIILTDDFQSILESNVMNNTDKILENASKSQDCLRSMTLLQMLTNKKEMVLTNSKYLFPAESLDEIRTTPVTSDSIKQQIMSDTTASYFSKTLNNTIDFNESTSYNVLAASAQLCHAQQNEEDLSNNSVYYKISYESEKRSQSQDLSSSDDEELLDHVSDRSQDTNTEQELSSNDEDEMDTVRLYSSFTQLFYTGKDGVTKWSSQNCHIKPENVIIEKPSVNEVACNAKTEFDCWKLFVNDDMIEQILYHTNVNIKKRQLASKVPGLVKEVTIDELLALFGLMYIAGLYRSDRQNLKDLWRSDGTGVDIFRTTMSLRRFNFLHNCLRFDDSTTREVRKLEDNLAPIRSIFDEFVFNCQNTYSPSEYLTIDEKLEAFGGKCSFRQFMPNKPAKYGIKMYALVDAKMFYTVNLEIYAGKQPEGLFSQSNHPIDVVDRLVQPISKSQRNVTFDNWFTSVPLVTHLLNNHYLTSTGTLCKNVKEIPPSFISIRGHKEYTSQFAFQKDMTLVSYRPKKSKVVLVLSSLHHHELIDSDTGDKQKPKILTFYNSTKSGVEVVDELCAMYDVSRNSKRWPMTVFYTIMNIAALNGFIVFRENNNSNTNRRDFIRELSLKMLERHLSIRKTMHNLPTELRKRIHEVTGETLAYPPAKTSQKYKRCKECPSVRDRKTKHICQVCNKPICMEHVNPLCPRCMEFNSVYLT